MEIITDKFFYNKVYELFYIHGKIFLLEMICFIFQGGIKEQN